VPSKTLLAVLSKAVGGGVYDDLIVAGVERYGFPGGVGCRGDEGEHVGFCDEFDRDVEVEFPCP